MKKKILLGVSILFGLIFIQAGLNKFFLFFPPPPEMSSIMDSYKVINWLMPLVAVVEIIGGILIMTNKFRALGAIIIFPAMIGILLFHIISVPVGLPMALILLGILIWIMFENREKYLPMVK